VFSTVVRLENIFRKPCYKYPELGCTAVGYIYGEQALEIN
jgi:hypothetical protein